MRLRSLVSVFVALVSVLSLGQALPEGWKSLATARKPEGNFRFSIKGKDDFSIGISEKSSGRLVVFRIEDDGEVAAEEILKSGKRVDLPLVATGWKGKEGDVQNVLIKVREAGWTVYLDEIPVAKLAAPFVLPGQFSAPEKQAERYTEKGKFIQTSHVHFVTDFMIEKGAKNELYPWDIRTGKWHLHTALAQSLERPETNQTRIKQVPVDPDRSPNFYSLKGGGCGEDCIITTGSESYDFYRLTASIQLGEGEAGVIFHHRDEAVAEGKTPDPAKASFYAFTLRRNMADPRSGEARLWKQEAGKKTLLAHGKLPLYDLQWYQSGIEVSDDGVSCYLDGYELLHHRMPVAPGGKIGLWVNSPKEMRFDDVAVLHADSRKFYTPAELAFEISGRTGDVTLSDRTAMVTLEDDAKVLIGRPHSANQVLEAVITPKTKDNWKTGLVIGWRDDKSAYMRFSVARKNDLETYALEAVQADGKVEALETFSRPLSKAQKEAASFKLMADASEKGVIRCLKDGELVLLHIAKDAVVGASGIWTADDTEVTATNIVRSFQRKVYQEQPQKNPIYQHDSFMRHWAAPEGQWVAGIGNAMWHKGDFFGDFAQQLPAIPGSEAHFAATDNGKSEALVVKVNDKGFELDMKAPAFKVAKVTVPVTIPDKHKIDEYNYVMHFEGYHVWIEFRGEIVYRTTLEQRLKTVGTKIFTRGLNLSMLARSKSTRANVIDEFFNESPHAWQTVGGDWQIINRFQCLPSWSHMIGQSGSGMSSLWRKEVFEGDMTLEFYAGTRMGWYEQAGNLNCTVMASDATPGSGYTVTCTEWDHNNSQNWSRIYRNSVEMAKSEQYLVPRRRMGMGRRLLNPLIAEGRPYHGAWFALKLRKIGTKLEYYFDDELIMTATDPQAIQKGLVGIWTFIHSMTLAQIKITFENVRPRPVAYEPLPLEKAAWEKPGEIAELKSTINGFPADAMNKKYWSVNDNVGQSVLTSFKVGGNSALMLNNPLGGGNMTMSAKLPCIPLAETAGFRMLVKRTPGARFNFAFEIGTVDKKGAFSTTARLYHRISGADYDRDSWIKCYETEVKPVSGALSEDKDWTEVIVWIPTPIRMLHGNDGKRVIRVVSFGIEQTDFLLSGLGGNPPGCAYAVAGLTPIRYNAPEVKANGEEKPSAADVTGATDGLNYRVVSFGEGKDSRQARAYWVQLPKELPVTVEWDQEYGDTVLVSSGVPYSHPAMMNLTGEIAGIPTELRRFVWNETFWLKMRSDSKQNGVLEKGPLSVTTSADAKKTFTLKADDPKRVNIGPLLADIKGFTPYFATFERGIGKPIKVSSDIMQHLYDDGASQQSGHLHVQNKNLGSRLMTEFMPLLNQADYPILQFRYAAEDMTHVSLYYPQNGKAIRLSSVTDASNAVDVRHSNIFVRDGEWHTWSGILTDALTGRYYHSHLLDGGPIRIGSIQWRVQSGEHSAMKLDDIVLGPSVNSAEKLAFTPEYVDLDGVAKVYWTQFPGGKPYHELSADARKALVWKEAAPGEAIRPTNEGLVDGVNHVAIYAVDKRGVKSNEFDLPFMLTRVVPEVSASVVAMDGWFINDVVLRLTANTHGYSPLRLDKLTLTAEGDKKPLRLSGWGHYFEHASNSDFVHVNYALALRKRLNKMKDKESLNVTFDDIQDGAGNKAAPVTYTIKTDYAKDKGGPNWLDFDFGKSVFMFHNWLGRDAERAHFRAVDGTHVHVYATRKEAECENKATKSYAIITMPTVNKKNRWKVAEYPYFAIRLEQWNSLTKDIQLMFYVGNKRYSLSLNNPGKGANELNRKMSFTWKQNTWNNFIFDIRQMLRDIGVSEDQIKQMVIDRFEIQRHGVKEGWGLEIRDFFIFGDGPSEPSQKDIAELDAYDISGIKSFVVTPIMEDGKEGKVFETESNGELDLAQARKLVKGLGWLRIVARDKAGNDSLPAMVPVKGTYVEPPKPTPAPDARPNGVK